MGFDNLSTDALEKIVKNKGNIKIAMQEFSDTDLEELARGDSASENIPETPSVGFGEKVARGAISTIPTLLGAGGAVVGSSAGPVGTIAGGTAGYTAGRSLEKGLKEYLFGEGPKTREELYKGTVSDISTGALQELGGVAVSKGIGLVGEGAKKLGRGIGDAYEYSKATLKPNIDEIKSAGEAVGVTPTRGMLSSNRLVGELESGLSQSGSIPAIEIRKQNDLLFSQLDAAKTKLSDKASTQSAYETGNIAKQNIESVIQENKTPVSELYNKLEPDFLNIPIDLKTVNRELGFLKKSTYFKTKDGEAVLSNIVDDLSKLDNLADLKEYRTNLLKSIPNTASDLDRIRLRDVYEKITNIRDNSIAALQNQPEFKFAPSGVKKELAQTVDQIALADSAHRANMEQINKVRHLFGQKEPFKSSSEFVRKISEIPNQNLTEKVFSSGNVNELKQFSEQFPDAFSQMKIQKFTKIIQDSMDKDGINFTRFNKNYEKLDPQIKDLIFDPETQSYIGALKTVIESVPERLGPSGTPQGLFTMNGINPNRILNDMWSKYLYKNSTPQGAMILNNMSQGLQGAGQSMQSQFTGPAFVGAERSVSAASRRLDEIKNKTQGAR